MSSYSNIAIALIAVAALTLGAAPALANGQPHWPNNHERFRCVYQFDGGTSGNSIVWFENLPRQAHVFPDGNQLKRGTLVTVVGGEILRDNAVVAWKPNELPDPPGGSNFELTLPRTQPDPIQCKNLGRYSSRLEFETCSNGIRQSCFRIW